MKYHTARGLGRVVGGLRHDHALALGRLLGRIGRLILTARRTVATINLERCFPDCSDAERRDLVRQAFEANGMGIVENLIAYWGEPEKLTGRYRIDGLSILEERDPERGALLLMGHIPCVELLARLINKSLDEPAAMMVRRNADPALEAAIESGRRNFTTTVGKKDMRAVVRLLRSGGALMYGPDLNFTRGVVFAPFFEVSTATLTTTADLIERTGAALIPIWGWRTAAGGYEIRIEPPWEDFPSGDAVADATRVNEWMESRIREHPGQYLWLHRRFRHRPEGEPAFYPPHARRAKHR